MSDRLATDNVDRVKWFLSHGADPNLRGSGRNKLATPLSTAAFYSDIAVLEALISGGADLDPEALVSAMSPRGHGGLPVMKFLINRGIDINAFRREGETPRHYAVTMGSREKVEPLLESGGWHNQRCEGLDPS
jgi:ankyrin repeat protein